MCERVCVSVCVCVCVCMCVRVYEYRVLFVVVRTLLGCFLWLLLCSVRLVCW